MEENNKSKSIVEAGIMSAITFVLMMLTSLPGIGTIVSFAIPILIALLYLKYNLKTSICSIVISGVLVGLFHGAYIWGSISYNKWNYRFGFRTLCKKKFSGIKSFVYLIVANTIGVLIEIALLFSVFTGISFNEYINDLVNTFNETTKLSEQMMGSSQANTQMIELCNLLMQIL